jgi:hypothetical protein
MSAAAVSVFFGGSRSLPAASAALVSSVVSRVAARGVEVAVGCCSGADRLALSAALAAAPSPDRLVVFAAFGPSGEGAVGPLSALREVQAAAAAGCRVCWWAGGPSALPVRARLVRRTRAAVASGSGPAVFFLSSVSSPGSLGAAAVAVACGRPVFAFCCGFQSAPSLVPGVIGRWVPARFAGLPCWRWQGPPVPPSLAL